ncbi:N-lysine methyltransferase SMYD2 [Choanephora cucurbitarum]|uniref:N-lysine methyltransferase SMYD2 n=1 Tax=Choanephora cucurbitarum TaxID=101091 RepID=A0A1C7NIX4_9FUNG|nr:N-lysine methyltransferase SMYD2 [Choanephora cucurbitarum]
MTTIVSKETVNNELSNNLAESCSISKKKKKSNKKKSSGPPPSPLNSFYEQALASYPVKLNNTKAKGRHAAAAENIEAGVTLCQEQATAFIVRSEFLDKQCHVCLADLQQKMMCSDCQKAFYCSKECLEKDNDVHVLACSSLKQAEAIGKATDVDPDLLRLMALLMTRRFLDASHKEENNLHVGPTPYWCVEDLISHRENANTAFTKVLTEASTRLLMEMPEKIHMSVEDMVTLACRINSNAHGLGDNHSRNTDVALGLFPLGALFFNHGCNPNTAFVGLPNGQLAFRTIRPVNKDEELVVSYIDLCSDRDERRQDLLNSKHFWCKCKRCSSSMDKSVDRFLQGIICKECQRDVYVIPPTPVEHLTKGNRNLYLEKGTFSCAQCSHEVSADKLQTVIDQANKTYTLGMAAIRQERNYRKGSEKLEVLTKSHSTRGFELHSLNSFRLNSLIPLMNCKRYNGDLKGAIDVNKSILNLMEQYADLGGLPGNTSEISDYWQNLGELCDKKAKESQGRSSVLEGKWLKEAKHAFTTALRIRSIVFGENHPKTLLVQKVIESL